MTETQLEFLFNSSDNNVSILDCNSFFFVGVTRLCMLRSVNRKIMMNAELRMTFAE